jgi:hypothetical protein
MRLYQTKTGLGNANLQLPQHQNCSLADAARFVWLRAAQLEGDPKDIVKICTVTFNCGALAAALVVWYTTMTGQS